MFPEQRVALFRIERLLLPGRLVGFGSLEVLGELPEEGLALFWFKRDLRVSGCFIDPS